MAEKTAGYRFGEFWLLPDAASLRRGDEEVDLPPKAFSVLSYLVERRQRVVTKQELVEGLWKDTFVTDDALVQVITSIRRALGDDSEHPRYIRTKPRVGYQFIARVEESPAPAEASAVAAPLSVWLAPITHRGARRLLLLVQVAYLALYSLTLLYLGKASRILASTLLAPMGLASVAVGLLVTLALIGVALRLYLITSVAFDHPETGYQFRRLFPALFVLDELWAFTPLLLVEATGLPVALVLLPVAAYAPFAQSTLMRTAYPTPPVA